MYLTRVKDENRVRTLLGTFASAKGRSASLNSSLADHDLNQLSTWLDELAFRANLSSAQRSIYLLCVAGALILSFLTYCLSAKPIFLFFAPVICCAAYFSVKNKIIKRAENFEKDYTALLLSLASAVRSGLDPLVALTQAGQLFQTECEVSKELAALKGSIDAGVSEDQALANFASSISHPDLALFKTAFILARKEGSGLGACLQRLVKVTRTRQSFRRKVRSAVAMQRLSAFGIVICTLVIGSIQWVTNPEALKIAWNDPFGFKLLLLGFGLVICGLVWMLALTRSRI